MPTAASRNPREAGRRLRREHLLLAAEAVFARRPYEEATMQEIADEAGLGMAALYRDFTSKDELYEAVVLGRLDEIKERVEAGPADADPADRLQLLAEAHAQHFIDHPHFFPVWAGERLRRAWGLKSRVGKLLEKRFAEQEEHVAAVMEAAVKKRLLLPLGTRLLTTVALGIFGSVMQAELIGDARHDARTCARTMLDLLYKGAGDRIFAAAR